MPLEIGQLIDGKYRIIRVIGEGGMGAVYEGENLRIGRRVAIKVLHAALTGNKEVVQRFEREAQAAGRIGSDHILEVIDLGELPDGDHFMVMEFLDGETLSTRMERLGRMTPSQVAPLAQQLLRGLGAAHKAGIVHRDLKPDNVFVLREKAGQPDFVKIIDFGISKFQPLSGEGGMKMTRTGTVMGTPYYMSPEQASGSKEADNRSDLYSVGVILYEAVTGRVPFEATTFNQLMFKIVLADIPPPQDLVPDLDPTFVAIILKGMARDLNYRFQTAEEFVHALEAWRAGTGKAVTLPPTHAADLIPPGAATRAQQLSGAGFDASGAPSPGTRGSWASSQSAIVPGKKSLVPLFLGFVGVGVLVLGGGLAYLLLGGKGNPDSELASLASAPAPGLASSRAAAPAGTSEPPVAPAGLSVAPAATDAPAPSRQASGTGGRSGAVRWSPPPKRPLAGPAPDKPPPPAKPPSQPKTGGPMDFGY
jgi:serine/threonine protein kinase